MVIVSVTVHLSRKDRSVLEIAWVRNNVCHVDCVEPLEETGLTEDVATFGDPIRKRAMSW